MVQSKSVDTKQKLPRIVLLVVLFVVCIAVVWSVARLIPMFVVPDTMDLMFIIMCSALFGYFVGAGYGKRIKNHARNVLYGMAQRKNAVKI